MSIELTLKINNQNVSSHTRAIKIGTEYPTINWDFDLLDRVVINEYTGIASSQGSYGQYRYEIRISTFNYNIGADSFVGNRSQTGWVISQAKSWQYEGIPLIRGVTYYGQVRVQDETGRTSEWETFSFKYNSLPVVSSASISPSAPLATNDLVLTYDYSDSDGDVEDGTLIKWFKNGEYQKQFDGGTTIFSDYLQVGDIWSASIVPKDGLEYGAIAETPQVLITSTSNVVSDINILPPNPNPDDILKIDYVASDATNKEDVLVRWYINGYLAKDYNNKFYIRPTLLVGDEVRCEIKPTSGNVYKSSSTVTIQSSNFVVRDITIDGRVDPLDVSSVRPSVRWKSYIPQGKEANYVSIKIGTFFEADNIYSQIFDFDKETFSVPSGLLNRGRDYYISVAISDSRTFGEYTSSHFRIRGSRWEESVSNSTGWTFETIYIASESTDSLQHHVVRVNDGTRFAEIKIYSSKIELVSKRVVEYTIDNTSSQSTMLTVAGKNNDIKIYINRELVIDGTGLFTQPTSSKTLEIGGVSSNYSVKYKYFFYTTSGYYLPDVDNDYANMQFHTYADFEDNEVVALNNYLGGKKVFGLNPDNTNEGSSIYALSSDNKFSAKTVARTYAPINHISKSPDGKKIVCSHSKGISVINGYLINPFNQQLIFVDNIGQVTYAYPNEYGWELVQNTGFTAAYIDTEGLNINTLEYRE